MDGTGRGLGDGTRRSARLAMHRFHHSGDDPIRVLLMGERRHLLDPVGALAERAAGRVWLTTRRGVDVDVLTDLAPVLRAVQGVFRTWRLWRYDVVVVALGDGLDAAVRPRTVERVAELLQEVLADAAGSTDVVVVGAQRHGSGRNRHVAEADDRLRAAVERVRSGRVRYRAVDVVDDPRERARSWAAAIGSEVAASLDRTADAAATTAATLRDRPEDESDRQRALDELQVLDSDRDPRLDDLVDLARTAFGTAVAEINFIDRDRQWKHAVSGAVRTERPRATSLCATTVQHDGPTVVGDARLDPALRDNPYVDGVRFYAAHPIESAEGYRIGSFCVYDPEPRDVRGMDLAVLRDLALLAQAAIVPQDTAPAGLAPPLVVPH